MKPQFSQNQRILLDLIRKLAPVPRVKLSDLSGLTPGAVTRHCKELLLQGLIKQGETSTGQRGQPAQPLLIDPNGGFSIGAAFYPNQIDLALIDFAGTVLAQDSFKFNEQNPTQTAKQLALLAQSMLSGAGLSMHTCLGVGLAVPGFSRDNSKARQTVDALNSWRNSDLQSIFEAQLQAPCIVENIASAGAFTQLYELSNRCNQHIIFLHIGYGIGAGIIAEGRLYTGHLGNAGEIGGLYPLDKPRPSGLDLLNTLANAGIRIKSMDDIDENDADIQPILDQWLSRASEQLTDIAHSAQRWFAPEQIVIGGPLSINIMQRIASKVAQKTESYVGSLPRIPISAAPQGARTTAIGAAFMPIHQLCSPNAKQVAN